MMAFDGKKLAAMIVARRKPEGGEHRALAPQNKMGDLLDVETGLKAAAEDIMRASRSDDPVLMIRSLKAFVTLMMESREEEQREVEQLDVE